MTIKIKFKNYVLNITIGRKLPWCQQVDLITIIKEYYPEDSNEPFYAEWIQGFFREKIS